MSAHVPVLLNEVLEGLNIQGNGSYVDGTFGRGGHAEAILSHLGPRGRLIAIDRDPAAIAAGEQKFAGEPRLLLRRCAFNQLAAVVQEAGISGEVHGLLLDLGVSSPQIDDPARGFSFSHDGPLDMRMDNTSGQNAAEWLAKIPERELARIISAYGEERYARLIARAIVEARGHEPITTTAQLAELIAAAAPRKEPGKHPATRTFQAIRIAVNGELEQLEQALNQSLLILRPSGRLCVISFHSLEDGIVKRFMQQHSRGDEMYAGLPDIPPHARPKLKRIGRAIHPTDAEIRRNVRARSAVLRVAERVAA